MQINFLNYFYLRLVEMLMILEFYTCYHGFTDNLKRKEGKSNDFSLIVSDEQQESAYHGENYQDCIFI
jgi:hypothetical protein